MSFSENVTIKRIDCLRGLTSIRSWRQLSWLWGLQILCLLLGRLSFRRHTRRGWVFGCIYVESRLPAAIYRCLLSWSCAQDYRSALFRAGGRHWMPALHVKAVFSVAAAARRASCLATECANAAFAIRLRTTKYSAADQVFCVTGFLG